MISASATATLDHLVVAATDLTSGAAWLEARLGVSLAPGGRHVAMGTHNRLLRLGEGIYLELIAVDPEGVAPPRPRWFGLDGEAMRARVADGPRLIHWVARTNAIDALAPRAGLAPTEILPMARGDYRWRIGVPTNGHLPGGGLLPTLIQWDVPFHPAERLPDSGCVLIKLEAFTPHADEIRGGLAALGLGRALDVQPAAAGEPDEFVAYLRCSRGLVELTGTLAV